MLFLRLNMLGKIELFWPCVIDISKFGSPILNLVFIVGFCWCFLVIAAWLVYPPLLCRFSLWVVLLLCNIVTISFHQKSLQIWVPGGKMWNHAQWAGKALSLPKLRNQKITWTNSLMKCFATFLGEQFVRSLFFLTVLFSVFFLTLHALVLVSQSIQKGQMHLENTDV